MRKKLLQLLTAKPFVPFSVELSSGLVHLIRYPDQAMLVRSLVFIGVPKGDVIGPEYADVAIVSLLHITKLELMHPTGAAG
jgi:hypothetical protein